MRVATRRRTRYTSGALDSPEPTLLALPRRALRPLASALALCVVFELPSLAQPDRVALSAVRVPADALLLLACALAIELTVPNAWPRAQRMARALLVAIAALLIVYRVDSALCLVLMRHPPVLYDQLFLVRHLAVLLHDLWGGWAWLGGAALLAVIAALAWLAQRLLRAAATGARRALPSERARARWLAGAFTFALLLALVPLPGVRWVAPELVANLIAARTLAQRIARGVEHSPYRAYRSLTLTRKPNLYVFFVESYGRVAASDPRMSATWRDALQTMEHELSAAGYHSASAFADAPISGGRSWLAHATLMTGTRVGYQALYQSLFPQGRARVPHLPAFLRERGYRTVLLAPADRPRPGVRSENPYDYERTIAFSQLNYRGPHFGWGRIPDQYSLAYAEDHVFAGRDARPLLFVFTMVSSHSPWSEVPSIVADARDPRAYAAMKPREPAHHVVALPKPRGALLDQTSRFTRDPHRRTSVADGSLRAAYIGAIAYDLALLRDALTRLRGDDLIFILGDHQPPLVTSERDDFAAPIHVLARDPGLLRELHAHGFTPGLLLAPDAPSALPHEALFSLLARTLVAAGGNDNPRPPYLPHGVSFE